MGGGSDEFFFWADENVFTEIKVLNVLKGEKSSHRRR